MRTFPTREALVTAYWRKLASRIGAAYKSHERVRRNAAPSRKLSRVGAAWRPHRVRPGARSHSYS